MTPSGEIMIEEISARPRWMEGSLADLNTELTTINVHYTSLLQRIEELMALVSFSPIWAPYLLNTNSPQIAQAIDDMAYAGADDFEIWEKLRRPFIIP